MRVVHRKICTGLLLLAMVSMCGCGVNNLPSFDSAANAAWHQLISEYQRRDELVAELLDEEASKGADAPLSTRLHSALESTRRIDLSPQSLNDAEVLKRFHNSQQALTHALAESRAQARQALEPLSTALQQTLSELNTALARIRAAHRDYNEAARRYNAELRTLPGRWWRDVMYTDRQPKATLPDWTSSSG